MNEQDYKLLINICYHCLRSNNLTIQQVSDIDQIISKLHETVSQIKTKENICFGKKSKAGAKLMDIKLTDPKQIKKTHTSIIGQK
jgi:hypothetical protein